MKRLSKLLTDNTDEANMQPWVLLLFYTSLWGRVNLSHQQFLLILFSLNGTFLFLKILRIFVLILSGRKTFHLYAFRYVIIWQPLKEAFLIAQREIVFPNTLLLCLTFPHSPSHPSCIRHSGIDGQFPSQEGKFLLCSQLYSLHWSEQMNEILAAHEK